jgi:hypothetical protein
LLCSPDWTRTCNLPASAFQVLGLQTCTTYYLFGAFSLERKKKCLNTLFWFQGLFSKWYNKLLS